MPLGQPHLKKRTTGESIEGTPVLPGPSRTNSNPTSQQSDSDYYGSRTTSVAATSIQLNGSAIGTAVRFDSTPGSPSTSSSLTTPFSSRQIYSGRASMKSDGSQTISNAKHVGKLAKFHQQTGRKSRSPSLGSDSEAQRKL